MKPPPTDDDFDETADPFDEAADDRLTVDVGPADLAIRLDRVIADRIDDLSRSRVKSLLEAGQVTLDGVVVRDPSMKPRLGQRIVLTLPRPTDDTPLAQDMPLDIVFEDADLVVLNKPPGLVVHPAPGNWDRTLVNALLAHCGDGLQGIGGVRRPGIVHRIDKDTSGLMVVAKTERAHAGLSLAFAAHDIERAYWALVWGVPSPRESVVDQPIGRSPTNRKKMAIVPGGKRAVTAYRVVRALGPSASLVECRLETGRTHQIRVHLTSLGHPLIGDAVYGRPPALSHRTAAIAEAARHFPRQALHAWLLGFRHPGTGETLRFECAMPEDMAKLIQTLE